MKKHTWKIISIALVLLLGGAFYYANEAAKTANEGIEITTAVKGNPDASVVVAEYSDFQCPACAAAVPVVEEMLAQYGDKVRFEYHHFPLITIHPHALSAAKAAEAAGQQGKFFQMHDMLFERQSTWSQSNNPTVFYTQYAEELGLDTALFKRHMNASKIEDYVRASFAEAREIGMTGTPSFTLNGERMEFASYQEFMDQIAAAIGAPVSTEGTNEAPIEFGI